MRGNRASAPASVAGRGGVGQATVNPPENEDGTGVCWVWLKVLSRHLAVGDR